MRFLSCAVVSVVTVLWFASPALAGNWGENWGTMIWGSVAAVPTMGWLGGGLLVGLLASLGLRRIRRVSTGLGLLLALAYAPVAEAETVSVPNTLTNGSVAEADAMNANFEAVRTGVNLALTSADVTGLTQFTNGTTADADEVNANFTAVVDGVNTALANRATDCAGAGGTWNAGTSTCTEGFYNCFIGGFCAQAAIDYPPAGPPFGYTNVYDGDLLDEGAALAAGCNVLPGSSRWILGYNALVSIDFEVNEVFTPSMCCSLGMSPYTPC
jgi:hypothetical protein